MRWDPLMVHSVHQSCVAFWGVAWILQWVLTECRAPCSRSRSLGGSAPCSIFSTSSCPGVWFPLCGNGALLCPSWSVHSLTLCHQRRSALTFVAFIDLQKAFDTAWVEGTLVRLHEVGVTGQMWHLMCHFLRDTQSQVRVGASLGSMARQWDRPRESSLTLAFQFAHRHRGF